MTEQPVTGGAALLAMSGRIGGDSCGMGGVDQYLPLVVQS